MGLSAARVKQLIIGIFLLFALLPYPVYAATQDAGTLPLISDVSAANITQTSATISWNTNGDATSQVFYDIVSHVNIADYAANVTDGSLVTVHSIPLTGLAPSTPYYYRVRSATNGDDNVSDEYTFTTLAPAAPPPAGGGGGGGGASGVTNLFDIITPKGRLTQAVTAESDDGEVELFMAKNTIAFDEKGHPLRRIIMRTIEKPQEPPESPADSRIIGLAYDFTPDGVTFNPPATLTFTYDPALIPDEATADSLVIALWDEESGEWVNLVSTVDPETNTITAQISGFTVFSVIAYTRPAAFTTSDLALSPTEVNAGGTVTVSAVVTNTGNLPGSYEVVLKINDAVVDTTTISLDGGASQKVTFTTSRDETGAYTVNVDGLTLTFVVKALPVPPGPPVPLKPAEFVTSGLTITPTVVDTGESVTISVLVNNTGELAGTYQISLKSDNVVVATKDVSLDGGASQMATFTTSKDVAGTYAIDIGGLSGMFTVRAAPPPIPTINWWLIGGLIAAAMIIGMAHSFLSWRHRASTKVPE